MSSAKNPPFPGSFEEFEKKFALPQHLSDRFRDLASSINLDQSQQSARPTLVSKERVPAASAEEVQKITARLREKWSTRKTSSGTRAHGKGGSTHISVQNSSKVKGGEDKKAKLGPRGKYQAWIEDVQDEHFVVRHQD